MNERLSLAELQLIIKDSLYMSLPDMYWVIAEIAELKENYNGHCYLELIEKLPDETSLKARVRAVIWSSRYRFLRTFFENTAGESLKEGLKVLVRVKIEYHELYGLSLVINDIDPAFTIGEMSARRQKIIKRLEEDGVLTMNKEMDFPLVPQRIAVISSANAAGFTDFMEHLKNNPYGYAFYTSLFESPMQGGDTEKGVIGALDRIARHIEKFDIAVIIRGGGSQTDLSWFDNYEIAYHITQFPVPVLTGIGHEKDLSVTDIVAWQALKTPTATADFIIECMVNAENYLIDMIKGIADSSKQILDENRNLIESSKLRLIPLAKMHLSDSREELSAIMIGMINTGKEFLMRARLYPENQRSRLVAGSKAFLSAKRNSLLLAGQNLAARSKGFMNISETGLRSLENSLKILNPENVLKRGYTITSHNGRIIKSVASLVKDDLIDTKFHDGDVKSKVM